MTEIIEFPAQPSYPPTLDEPIPTLVGTPGLTLLQSATARRLAETATASETAELIQVEATLRAALRPPSGAEIATEIEALALHYPTLRRNEAEHRLVARHWIEDLDGIPVDLIREACRLWRNSPAERFPTSGQLKKLVEPILNHRRMLARRAADFLYFRHEPRQDQPA